MISALITDECSHWIARISQLDGEPGDVAFDDFGGDDCGQRPESFRVPVNNYMTCFLRTTCELIFICSERPES